MSLRLLVLFFAVAACASAQTTLYSETFAGSGSSNLHGTAPAVRPGTETWISSTGGTSWQADGSIVGGGASANSFLPFSPASGHLYTLSLDANPIGATSNWFALGFTATAAVGTGFQATPPGPAAWMLLRGARGGSDAVQTFLGPGTNSGANHTASSGTINLKIVLDTSGAQWTSEWFINGTSVREQTFGTNPPIAYIGFGTLGGLTGTVDNFTLTSSAIPEPSTYAALFGGLTLAFAAWRRSTSKR